MNARALQRSPHGSADFTTSFGMFNPEIANPFVPMTQREAVIRFRMREARGIEIKLEPLLLRPINPTLKMCWSDLIAVHELPSKLTIHCMEIKTMTAGNKAVRLLEICPEFIDRGVEKCFRPRQDF